MERTRKRTTRKEERENRQEERTVAVSRKVIFMIFDIVAIF